ncbi:tRNA lysidine(34) synthetase TilS [Cohaesibacter sp. ES.047]|uniref:tRNA lysidine(34) synthetase TilS n=1 Tax=Cohaesibacter sp. ES.047 TaxID=1798205 RepID=UPI0015616621|nr:tRNA lysidine(34) synthetase TilS [Cohaesibacter sp. ES.047]
MDEIDAVLAPLRQYDRLLLAVSGGADSLALMIFCAEWRTRCDAAPEIMVASVDHGLRADSAKECAYVADLARTYGLAHSTLSWLERPVGASLQAQARDARYRLLAAHADERDCSAIVLAHHLNDQAETVIMRLMRGSGVTGLGAIHAVQPFGDLKLLRPLLDVPKARLMASLVARGAEWIEDPSNQSPDYLRVRVRGLMPQLAQEGCDAARLAATARRMQRADDALNGLADDAFHALLRREPGRALSFDPEAYAKLHEEVRLRLGRLMLCEVAGLGYPPREERLISLDRSLCDLAQAGAGGGAFQKRTMGGCCFDWVKGRVWVYREPGRAPKTEPIVDNAVTDWQGLYDIKLLQDASEHAGDAYIRMLGADGRSLLLQDGLIFSADRAEGEAPPLALIEALPAIWWSGAPRFVVDWPEVGRMNRVGVDFKEKNTKFMD